MNTFSYVELNTNNIFSYIEDRVKSMQV